MANDNALPTSVAVLYSEVKREYFPTDAQYLTEKSAEKESEIISSYLEKLGIKTWRYPANPQLVGKLLEVKPDMVLNLVGSIRGQEYLASTIPGILEMLNIPYTGAGILGESLAYNKFLVKKLLQAHGVPVPQFQLLPDTTTPIDPLLRYPLITKLNEIHGAVEITKDAVSENEKHLKERVKFLSQTYKQPVLVEEFIVGREITTYLLEGVKRKVYFGEKVFKYAEEEKYVFADFESQWLSEEEDLITYQKFEDPVLREYVKKAFDILDMADYGKFDVRIDQSGRYYFLDSNSNPFFGPKEIESPMAIILDMNGVSFSETLKRLLLNTMNQGQQ